MRRVLLGTLCLLAVSAAWAGIDPGILPHSNHYQGRHSFAVNDEGKILTGHLEFAVYDTQKQTLAGYERSERFVYAYQIFSYNTSTAPLTYFSLAGINNAPISADGINARELFAGANSTGVKPTSWGFENAKAAWVFANGALVATKHSWFLFLYSDTDWTKGTFEVKSSFEDDIPIPTPEPTTLALIAGGAILSLRRKRQ